MKIPRTAASLMQATAPTLLAALSLDEPFDGIAASVVAGHIEESWSGSDASTDSQRNTTASAGEEINARNVVKKINANAQKPDFIYNLRSAEKALKEYEERAGIRFSELDVSGLLGIAVAGDQIAATRLQKSLPQQTTRLILFSVSALVLGAALFVIGAWLERDVQVIDALSPQVLVTLARRSAPWVGVALCGGLIGALELMSSRWDSRLAAFRWAPAPSLLYVAVNAAAALVGLWLLLSYRLPEASRPVLDATTWADVVIAIVASLIFMRGTIFTVHSRDVDIPVGPAVILSVLGQFVGRTVDRNSATAKAMRLKLLLRGVTFQAAREILLPGVLTVAPNLVGGRRLDVERVVQEIASQINSDEAKVVALGLFLSNLVGETPLRIAVTTFGAELRAGGPTDAVRALSRRIEGLLIQPALTRYIGAVVVRVQRSDQTSAGGVLASSDQSVLAFAPSEEGELLIQFRPDDTLPNAGDGGKDMPPYPIAPAEVAGETYQNKLGPTVLPSTVVTGTLRIAHGEENPEVVFDVAIDADEPKFERNRAACRVSTRQSSEYFRFRFVAPPNVGDHEISIEVSQLNRLVEVIPVSIVVQLGK